MGDTPRSQTISTILQEIAEQAVRYPDSAFTTLAHKMDVDLLREAYRRVRKSGAPGVDGVTAQEYAANLEENLRDLHERLRRGRYKAPPVERVWLDKEDGRKRPLGKPTFEDKIVQKAVAMLLEAVYEPEFYAFSHGFRPDHSPHQALLELRERCRNMNVGWIAKVDVSGFFDNMPHGPLREIIKQRVNDGGILRLIGKWLHAGVLEGATLTYPEKGTPQGGVISPLLANIFLHHVLDEWFVQEIQPRLRGRCFLIRYGDDFVIGFELEADARRVMDVLPKRFGRFGLTIHPEKTKLVSFHKPPHRDKRDRKNGTFDFLGFTHYWAKSRRGYWVIKRKTARRRLRRAIKARWHWCRDHRHQPLREQYRMLCLKLRGYYQYYGIRGNFRGLERVYQQVKKAWWYWLRRRSHKGQVTWEQFTRLRVSYPLPKPRIVHNI